MKYGESSQEIDIGEREGRDHHIMVYALCLRGDIAYPIY